MTGIDNAFPDIPLNLLNQLAAGTFKCDDTYWTMVRIEQIRTREKSYVALVIKHLQELARLKDSVGDGSELPDDIKAEVEGLVGSASWL